MLPDTFSKVWTHNHSVFTGHISEILAFDRKTNTLWVAGSVGVDGLDAAAGNLVELGIPARVLDLVNDAMIGISSACCRSPVILLRTSPGDGPFLVASIRALK